MAVGSQLTNAVVLATYQMSPAFGDRMSGTVKVIAPSLFESMGVAVVVITARARAERIAVKNRIAKA